MYPTDLTVSAVIEHEGRYLLVEEYAAGDLVLNQPGGHIEAGESPEEAVIREVLEETGCNVSCGELIGMYLWIHPQTRQQFVKIVYVGSFLGYDEGRALDDGIVARPHGHERLAGHNGYGIVCQCQQHFIGFRFTGVGQVPCQPIPLGNVVAPHQIVL